MLRNFFCILYLLIYGCLSAQPDLGKELTNIIQNNEPNLLVKLDTRNGFISNAAIKVLGVKAGFNFDNTLHIGLGYHWLTEKSRNRISRGFETVRVNYVSVFGEYWFYRKNKFHCSMPLQLGVGTVRKRNLIDNQKQQQTVLLYENMLTGEYRVFKYFGLGLGLGYRINFIRNTLGVNLTSPVYALKFNCYIGDLYKDIRNK